MIALDAKGYCSLDHAVGGIGWWWGEVGGVVAGSDGAVVNDGESPHITCLIRLLMWSRFR
jgi:hypothetical protein